MLKFALVGCGRIAKRHSELLGEGQIEGACLAAVCDIVVDRAQVIADKYAIPAYSDMHEMMAAESIDVVVVLTESGLHAQHALELAPYGADIVVEKPMALTLSDADMMIEACDKAGVKLFVVKQNRFNVPVVQLRKALEGGRFGRLIMGTIRVRWCRPQLLRPRRLAGYLVYGRWCINQPGESSCRFARVDDGRGRKCICEKYDRAC